MPPVPLVVRLATALLLPILVTVVLLGKRGWPARVQLRSSPTATRSNIASFPSAVALQFCRQVRLTVNSWLISLLLVCVY